MSDATLDSLAEQIKNLADHVTHLVGLIERGDDDHEFSLQSIGSNVNGIYQQVFAHDRNTYQWLEPIAKATGATLPKVDAYTDTGPSTPGPIPEG